eukprot:NODE_120_length_1365_cov_709.028116_g97_i1.p1 GENE.NODE_120_length_1365_cov_709.028116_g97_i1~~NODE_120_length_1365_cov_709.028116_g97_i1.p1  ORF type:complete len:454 (-),score=108.23 NODE_120_length_1365_cov_709.028116_g97_i1:4-1341(-)
MGEQCQAELERALPGLRAAQQAVRNMDKSQLNEIRSLASPPPKVKTVLEAVCIMLDEAPVRKVVDGRPQMDYWETARKRVMNDTQSFMNRLVAYEVDEQPNIEKIMDSITRFTKDRQFKPEQMRLVSVPLEGLCKWVIATEQFYWVNKKVKPQKIRAAEAEADFQAAMSDLNSKKAELDEVDRKLSELQAQLDTKLAEKKDLEETFENTEKRLQRATKLLAGLGGEGVRYRAESQRLQGVFANILGDLLVSAGFIAYLGPFVNEYRQVLVKDWVQLCQTKGIPGSSEFALERFLGNPVEIQEWKQYSLPADSFSIDNAIIMKYARRWPLCIDPQCQANRFVKQKEINNRLAALRPTEHEMHRSMTLAMQSGTPVLLENVEEEIDPVLEPLLLKQFIREGPNSLVITLGEQTTEYNEAFRFYMTTKRPRPNYRPKKKKKKKKKTLR